MKRFIIFILAVLLLLLPLDLVSASWWNTTMPYKSNISITNNDPTNVLAKYYTFELSGWDTTNETLFNNTLPYNYELVCDNSTITDTLLVNTTEITSDGSTKLYPDTNGWFTTNTTILFRLPNNITTSSTNTTMCDIYYGNLTYVSSANNESNIALFFDQFDRADSATLGNGWSEDATANYLQISSGTVQDVGSNNGIARKKLDVGVCNDCNYYQLLMTETWGGTPGDLFYVTISNWSVSTSLAIGPPTDSGYRFHHENGGTIVVSQTPSGVVKNSNSGGIFSSGSSKSLTFFALDTTNRGDFIGYNKTGSLINWSVTNITGVTVNTSIATINIMGQRPGDAIKYIMLRRFIPVSPTITIGLESGVNDVTPSTSPTLIYTNITPLYQIKSSQLFTFLANISITTASNVTLNIQSDSGINTNITTNNITSSEYNGTYNATVNTTYRVRHIFVEQGSTITDLASNSIFRLWDILELLEEKLANAIMSFKGSEDNKTITVNISINKNATIDYISFNISAEPYENKSEFTNGNSQGWSCTLQNPNANNNYCKFNNSQAIIFSSGGISVSGAVIRQDFNLSEFQYISFEYNITEADEGFFFGFGQLSTPSDGGVAFSKLTTGSGLFLYDITNRSGNTTISIGVYDGGVAPGTNASVDNIRLYNYPSDIIIDIGNYSDANELRLHGYMVGNGLVLKYFNNTASPFNLTFTHKGNFSRALKIPFGADIDYATMNLSGYNDTSFFANDTTTYNNSFSGTENFVFSNNSKPSTQGQSDVTFDELFGASAGLRITFNQALGQKSIGTDAVYDCSNLLAIDFSSNSIDWNISSPVFCLNLNNKTGLVGGARVKMIMTGTSGGYSMNYTLYNATGFEYPINFSIDIGDDNTKEFSSTNNFSSTQNKTSDFSSSITSYLNSCSYDTNNICQVPVVFYSNGRGVVRIEELYVNYTNVTNVKDFKNISNDYIHDQCISEGYNCTLPIRLTYNLPGNITFLNLENFYTVPQPVLTLDNPTEGEQFQQAKVQLDFSISNYTNPSCKYSLQYPLTLAYEVQNQSISCLNQSITPQVVGNYTLYVYLTDEFGRESSQKRNFTLTAIGGSALGGAGLGQFLTPEPAVCGDGKCEILKGEGYYSCGIDCGTLQNISLSGLTGNIVFLKYLFLIMGVSILILTFIQDKKRRRKIKGDQYER